MKYFINIVWITVSTLGSCDMMYVGLSQRWLYVFYKYVFLHWFQRSHIYPIITYLKTLLSRSAGKSSSKPSFTFGMCGFARLVFGRSIRQMSPFSFAKWECCRDDSWDPLQIYWLTRWVFCWRVPRQNLDSQVYFNCALLVKWEKQVSGLNSLLFTLFLGSTHQKLGMR